MNILGIETSCDETAAAVIADGRRILSNVVASQVAMHAPFGGIVPEVASRAHLLQALPIVEQAMAQAEATWADIAAIGVTVGPGLAGSLLVGVNLAKAIAYARNIPLVAVNHLEAHIYANRLATDDQPSPELFTAASLDSPQANLRPPFPLVCLIVSGGHTELILMLDHGRYRRLGGTRDDAAGEAFDKVARILGLGYPGGPAIERAAVGADPTAFAVPRPWLRGSDDFSFSGLKTAMLHLARQTGDRATQIGLGEAGGATATAALAAAFEAAVVEVLVGKTVAAAERLSANGILLSGGVAANKRLRQALRDASPLPVVMPPPYLCTDNAAMVAACAHFRFERGAVAGMDVEVEPSLKLG